MALEAGAKALLTEGRNFAHVVSSRRNGEPRVVLVWVDADAEHVLLNGQEGARQWLEDVRNDPRVIVTVVNHDDPYEYVTIEGTVESETHEGANAHIDKLAQKYWGTDYGLEAGAQRVLVRVRPQKVRHRGGG